MFTFTQRVTITTIMNTEIRKDGGRNNLFINSDRVVGKMQAQGGSIKRQDGGFTTVMNGSNGEVYRVELQKDGTLSCGCKFFELNGARQAKGCKHTIALVRTLAKHC